MIRSNLGDLSLGEKLPPRLMGVINLSPESFFQGSVETRVELAVDKAREMVDQGAEIVDLGGMSTAPYKDTYVSEEEELERIVSTVEAIAEELDIEVSVDTQRSKVAEEAIKAGATIINDVSGFTQDPEIAEIIADYGVSAIVMAFPKEKVDLKQNDQLKDPIKVVRKSLKETLQCAKQSGISEEKIVVDPGIGFWRKIHTGWNWLKWDLFLLRDLERLFTLRKPLCVGVSRKSFIGEILDQKDPEERLIGSVTSEALAVRNGADLIRTHNINETRQAVKIAYKIKKKRQIIERESFSLEELPQLNETDIADVLDQLNVHPGGIRIMEGKGVHKNILLRNIPTTLALVLKQEMLEEGGEAALPEKAVLGKGENVDVVLMGNHLQFREVIRKLRQMDFSHLKNASLNGPTLSGSLSRFF